MTIMFSLHHGSALGAPDNQLVVRLFNSWVGQFSVSLVGTGRTLLVCGSLFVFSYFGIGPHLVAREGNEWAGHLGHGLCSRTSVSVGSSDVFCETQEPGPDTLITNSLFDCSIFGSGTSLSPLVGSEDTSLLLEVHPHFHIIPDSVPNSLLVKAASGLVTLDTVPSVTHCSRTSVSVGSYDVFCETQESGPDILITNSLFDCSTFGSGNFPSPLVSALNSVLVKAGAGSVTLDTVPSVMLYSRTSVSDSSSDVFCETQEPGPDFLITNPLFDCSTLGSGTLPLSMVESVDTSLQFEVPPLFQINQDSAFTMIRSFGFGRLRRFSPSRHGPVSRF